jgi:cytochrome b involved in lipid metabolism
MKKVPSSSRKSSLGSWIETLTQYFGPVDDDDNEALYNPRKLPSNSSSSSSSKEAADDDDSKISEHSEEDTASETEELSSEEEDNEKKTTTPKKKYIQINGAWYDITRFRHPGGAVIDDFVGRDATEVFTAFHVDHVKVLKRVKRLEDDKSPPPKKYIAESKTIAADVAFSKDYQEMVFQLKEEGYFAPNLSLMVQKMVLAAVCFVAGWYLVFLGTAEARSSLHTNDGDDDAVNSSFASCHWPLITAGAIFVALFFQQCGFLLHDFMHNNWFHNRKIDQAFGRFFGAVCVGISGVWWRDEHWIHHVFTNTYEDGVGIKDIQIAEDVWAQNAALLQFFDGSIPETTWVRLLHELPLGVAECVIRYQAFLWLPLTVILGRMNIIAVSFLKETNTSERMLQMLHITWFGALSYAAFPDWKSALAFHLLVSVGQGVLHLQLLVSHYVTPWYDLSEMQVSSSWYKKQIMATINVAPLFSTRWLRQPWGVLEDSAFWNTWDDQYAPLLDDWFHGGLNLHVEHHTMPTLPRNSLREASRRIKVVCQKHGLYYDERHFIQAVWDTLVQLHRVGKQAKFTKSSTTTTSAASSSTKEKSL